MKKIILKAIITSALISAFTVGANASDTILSSSDFDTNFGSWYVTTMGGASISQATENPKAGDSSILVTGRTDTWNSLAQNITDKLENNTKYEFSVWVKLSDDYTDEATVKVGLTTKEVDVLEEYDKYSLTNNTVTASKDEWREIKGTFETAWSGTLEKVEFKVADETSLNSFYVDEVSITKLESVEAPEIETDIPSLKDVYEDYFSFGVALPSSAITNDTTMALVSKHFNSVTHENDLKPEAILGTTPNIGEDGFPILDFTKSDIIMDGILAYNNTNPENEILLRGHVLAWHSQTPDWFFRVDYDVNNDYVTPDVMNARLEEYIKDVLAHYHGADSEYDGLIYAWDVINEVINPSDGLAGGLRKTAQFGDTTTPTGYYEVYGESNEYIKNAFIYANTYAPADVKLYYNDYNETETVKSQNIYDLIAEIQNTDGARIDGMGMQAHYALDNPTVSQIETAILKYASLGIEVQITELDMKVSSGSEGTYEEELIKQAYHYKNIFEMFKKVSDDGVNLTNVTVWGATDAHSWLSMPEYSGGKQHYPLLFDGDYKAKPAYYGIVDPSQLTPLIQNAFAYKTDEIDAISPINIGNSELSADVKFTFDDENLLINFDVLSSSDYEITVYTSPDTKFAGENDLVIIPIDTANYNEEIKLDIVIENENDKICWSDTNFEQETHSNYYGKVTLKPFIEIEKAKATIDWSEVSSIPLTAKTNDSSNNATAKLLWDEEYLYAEITVIDDLLNKDSANAYEHDSVEVFLNQNNEFSDSYQADDAQYRINFDNEQSFNGSNADNIESSTVITDNGYVVTLKIKLTDINATENTVIGLDLQVNEADDTGARVGVTTWFDTTGMGWSNPSVFGKALLVDNEVTTSRPRTETDNSDDESNENSTIEDGEISLSTNDFLKLTDITNHWAYESIKFVFENGLMMGVSDTEFDSESYTNRAMIWTILARINDVDTENGENWYDKAMTWAVENGISDGTNPMGEITREQLVTMLWRNAGEPVSSQDLSVYEDLNDVSDYAKNAFAWAVENGYVLGKTETTLAPKDNATRAEVAVILERLMK